MSEQPDRPDIDALTAICEAEIAAAKALRALPDGADNTDAGVAAGAAYGERMRATHPTKLLALLAYVAGLEETCRRHREALNEIIDQDWVENALDPQWAARIARAALTDNPT